MEAFKTGKKKKEEDCFSGTDAVIDQRNKCIALGGIIYSKLETGSHPCDFCGSPSLWNGSLTNKAGKKVEAPICNKHKGLGIETCSDLKIPFAYAPCFFWSRRQVCPRFSLTPIVGEGNPVIFHSQWKQQCQYLYPLKSLPLSKPTKCALCDNPASVRAVLEKKSYFSVTEMPLCEHHAKMGYGCNNVGIALMPAPCVLLANNEDCIFFES
jgi:hypothetical protein